MPAMAIWCLWGMWVEIGEDPCPCQGQCPLKGAPGPELDVIEWCFLQKKKKRRLGACLTVPCTAETWGKHFGEFLFLVAYVLSSSSHQVFEWDMSLYAWPIHLPFGLVLLIWVWCRLLYMWYVMVGKLVLHHCPSLSLGFWSLDFRGFPYANSLVISALVGKWRECLDPYRTWAMPNQPFSEKYCNCFQWRWTI